MIGESVFQRLQIEYLKSITYTEINDKFNKLNIKINKLEKELKTIKTK